MGYGDNESSVRVDFFKESGKWYCTEAVIWKTYKGSPAEGGKLIHDAFAEALVKHLRDADGHTRLRGMVAVCLEPYHEHPHPLMLGVEKALAIVDGTAPKYVPLNERLPRRPEGHVNNCALANGDEESNCQICPGVCPDRARLKR